jgi:hypothetical protein
MPRRRIAAEVLVKVDGLFRRSATRSFVSIVAILFSPAAAVHGDDLSDRSAAVAGADTAAVASIAESFSAGDADFDPADPELSAEELSTIDREEAAAAFAPSEKPAAADSVSADSVSAGANSPLRPSASRASRRAAVSFVSTALVGGTSAAALPEVEDDLWLVSSRCARCETDGSVRLHYWQYAGGCWEKRTLADLLAADPSIRTCIHVHGNRCDFAKANTAGWAYYSTLTGGCVRRPPMRFIVFTWPSDRIQGSGRKDVQTKAVRAECHAFYLAWLVRQLSAETPLSMVGYSFGTRVIGGTLHLLGGGTLRGRSVGPAVERPGIRVVMLAAAMDNSAFLPGCTFQCGPCQIDQILVTRNTADPAMKWYPLMYRLMLFRKRGQQALGYTGLAGLNCLPCLQGRVRHCDVTCAVGKEHDWSGCAYLMPGLSERMRQYIYHEPIGAAASKPAPTPAPETAAAPEAASGPELPKLTATAP